MTHVPINLPLRGFTEQNSFSAVPQGMTPSCLNVMPRDPWGGRMRIGTRNGTRRYNIGGVQFIGTYRINVSGVLTERLIVVQAGVVKWGDPQADLSGALPTLTTFAGQGTLHLSNTADRIDGVQFNQWFFFCDGLNYAFIDLTAVTPTVAVWGSASGSGHGPYRTNTGTSAGDGASLMCRWGARIVLSGYKKAPNVWFACEPDEPYAHAHSGSGGPTDGWNFTDAIGSGATGGTVTDSYGTLGDPIVAIFPFAGVGLMFGCSNSMYYLTGDPVFTDSQVQLLAMSRSVGIVGPDAWCQSQEKGAWMLARDGLYYLSPNTFNIDRSARVSAGRLDSFFLRLDFGTPAVGSVGPNAGGSGGGGTTGTPPQKISAGEVTTPIIEDDLYGSIDVLSGGSSLIGGVGSGDVLSCLCYDPDREGVWVFLTVSGVEENSIHLFYDMKTDSFWPQRLTDPLAYGPARTVFVQGDRTKENRLFMGGADSISVIGTEFAIGIDGYSPTMTDEEQRARLIRSSLTIGPIIAPLPYRLMLTEVRVDMAEEKYELPSGFTDLSEPTTLSVSTGDTAQIGLGIQTDELFVTPLNLLVVDGGVAQTPFSPVVYNGGTAGTSAVNTIDGRFAQRPFGRYAQDNPFAEGTSRTYTGPTPWIIVYDGANDEWTIDRVGLLGTEYAQVSGDEATPDGVMESAIQLPVSPDVKGNAVVSGASFPEAEVIQIGTLRRGRNVAKRCRIRAEAMYLTVASDGRPFAIERASALLTQVGKSRGGDE